MLQSMIQEFNLEITMVHNLQSMFISAVIEK